MRMNWKAGDRILITHAKQGTSAGKIARVSTIEELPDLPLKPGIADIAKLILAEAAVTQLLLIAYQQRPGGPELMFHAMVRENGEVFDLRRQRLTITRLEPTTEAIDWTR